MITNEPSRIKDFNHVLNNTGAIFHKEGKFNEALDYHQRALEMREKYHSSDHIGIVNSLNNFVVLVREKIQLL